MKKISKRRNILLIPILSILMVLMLTGCGNNLEGSYYEVGHLDYKDEKVLKPVTANLRSTHFDFNKDGTVQCYENDRESYSGTYEIDGSRITIYIEDGQGTTLSGSVNKSSSLEKYYGKYDYYKGEEVEKVKLRDDTEMDAKKEYKSIYIDDTLYILIHQ
jgi:hypothetical protein